MRRPSAALALVAALALGALAAGASAAAASASAAPTDGAKQVVATVPGEFVTDATSPDGSVEYEPSEYEYEVMPEGYVPQPGEVVYEYDPKMFESAKGGAAAGDKAGGELFCVVFFRLHLRSLSPLLLPPPFFFLRPASLGHVLGHALSPLFLHFRPSCGGVG